MPVFLSEFLRQIQTIWTQLDGRSRLNVAAVLLATLAGLGALVWFGSRPDYVAFTDYREEDRAMVFQTLDRGGIDYRIEAGVLHIEGSQRDSAIKLLSSQSLTSVGDSADGPIDTKTMVGPTKVTDYILQQKRLAVLKRDIQRIRGVSYASVHWHAARRSRFLGRDQGNRSRASVMIGVRDPNRFRSVAHDVVALVGDALDIPHPQVTVISKDGGIYTSDAGGIGGGSHMDLIRLESEQSSQLTAAAQFELDGIVGIGKAKVTVNVDLDNSIQTSEEVLTPSDKILIREKGTKNKTTNGKGAAGGDPGSGSTLSGGTASDIGNQNRGSETNNSTTEKDYLTEIGRKRVVQVSPDIKRITVGLALDKSIEAKRDDVVELIKGVIGWSQGRDPDLRPMIVEMPSIEEPEPEGFDIAGMIGRYGPMAAQILSVLLVVLFLKGVLKKVKPAPVARAPAAKEEDDDQDPRRESRRLRREIEKAVAADPGSVSRLLEGWLTDSKVES